MRTTKRHQPQGLAKGAVPVTVVRISTSSNGFNDRSPGRAASAFGLSPRNLWHRGTAKMRDEGPLSTPTNCQSIAAWGPSRTSLFLRSESITCVHKGCLNGAHDTVTTWLRMWLLSDFKGPRADGLISYVKKPGKFARSQFKASVGPGSACCNKNLLAKPPWKGKKGKSPKRKRRRDSHRKACFKKLHELNKPAGNESKPGGFSTGANPSGVCPLSKSGPKFPPASFQHHFHFRQKFDRFFLNPNVAAA